VNEAICEAQPVTRTLTASPEAGSRTGEDQADSFKFLIRVRDAKFIRAVDAVLAAVGVRIIATPVRGTPGERDRRTADCHARCEWLDRVLITCT